MAASPLHGPVTAGASRHAHIAERPPAGNPLSTDQKRGGAATALEAGSEGRPLAGMITADVRFDIAHKLLPEH
jgi:hypothetical protein